MGTTERESNRIYPFGITRALCPCSAKNHLPAPPRWRCAAADLRRSETGLRGIGGRGVIHRLPSQDGNGRGRCRALLDG